MIKPTVGRVVLYNPLDEERDDIRHAAIVVMVHSDECVNLVVFDANGVPYHRQSVVLIQDSIVNPKFGECEWMPYQHGQAAKYDTGLDTVLARLSRIETLLVEEAGFDLGELVMPPVLKEDTAEVTGADELYQNNELASEHAEGKGNVVDLKPNDDNDPGDDDEAEETGGAGSGDGSDGTDESTDDVTEDDAGTGEGTETEANALGEAAEKSAALSGLMAHALEVELETISFMDEEGEPVGPGQEIHETEYTFADGVSFVVNVGEHLLLEQSGLSVPDKEAQANNSETDKFDPAGGGNAASA